MAYETILYEKRDHLVHLTLNRPEKLNAMNTTMLEEIADAVEAFEADEEAWVGIISATGRSFCAGRDVSMFQDRLDGSGAAEPSRPVGPPFLDAIQSGKPIIGAVQGHVFGLGIMLAGECSVLIAAEDAQFGMTEVKRSLSGGGAWGRITQWIPSKLATEMAITGDPIGAQEAYQLGLANRVVTRDGLMAEAERVAERVLANPPLAVRATIQGIRTSAKNDIDERLSNNPNLNLNATEDYREAIESFLEKRKPVFKGR